MKPKRRSRRRLYWAWASHLAEGRMLLLESKRRPLHRDDRPMVRVRIEIIGMSS